MPNHRLYGLASFEQAPLLIGELIHLAPLFDVDLQAALLQGLTQDLLNGLSERSHLATLLAPTTQQW